MKIPSISTALVAAFIPLTFVGVALASPPGTGSMTGTVSDTSGNRLSGVCVDVSDDQGNLGEAQTSTAGEYVISDLPSGDSMRVLFHDCHGGNYVTQWYDGAATYTDATLVQVPDGGTLSGIDATLSPGVSFAGTVTDPSGAPIQNVCVFVTPTDYTGSAGMGTSTDTNGNWSGAGLPPGPYIVEFDQGCYGSGSYAKQWYDGVSSQSQATTLNGSAGQSFTNIDAQLQPTQSNPPVITGVSPNSGPPSGGTEVTITGTDLSSLDNVMFGSRQASDFHQLNATSAYAISPPGSAGTVDVSVTTQAGTSAPTSADQFTYDPSQPANVPTITSVSPNSGPSTGGGFVTIDGQNLASTYAVYFGTVQSQTLTQVSNTEITARIPAHDPGAVDITAKTQALGPTAPTPADEYTYGSGVSPVLPEAPLPLLIPVAGIVATAVVVRRRRQARAAQG